MEYLRLRKATICGFAANPRWTSFANALKANRNHRITFPWLPIWVMPAISFKDGQISLNDRTHKASRPSLVASQHHQYDLKPPHRIELNGEDHIKEEHDVLKKPRLASIDSRKHNQRSSISFQKPSSPLQPEYFPFAMRPQPHDRQVSVVCFRQLAIPRKRELIRFLALSA